MMSAQDKQTLIKDIEFQTKMLNNLKKWLRNLIYMSTFSFVLIIFGTSFHPIIQIIGIVFVILCVLGSIIVGLGLRNGQIHIRKLIDTLENH